MLEEEQLALTLVRAYLATDNDVWSNKAHIAMYQRTGQLIGEIIRQGGVKEEVLWSLSDQEFWELLRTAADPDGLETMKRLESGSSQGRWPQSSTRSKSSHTGPGCLTSNYARAIAFVHSAS